MISDDIQRAQRGLKKLWVDTDDAGDLEMISGLIKQTRDLEEEIAAFFAK
jgi:hypothetical protein